MLGSGLRRCAQGVGSSECDAPRQSCTSVVHKILVGGPHFGDFSHPVDVATRPALLVWELAMKVAGRAVDDADLPAEQFLAFKVVPEFEPATP